MDGEAGQEKKEEGESETPRRNGEDAPKAAGKENRRRASRHEVSAEVQGFPGTIHLPWGGSVMGRMGTGM